LAQKTIKDAQGNAMQWDTMTDQWPWFAVSGRTKRSGRKLPLATRIDFFEKEAT
jgi:hypothetical protein